MVCVLATFNGCLVSNLSDLGITECEVVVTMVVNGGGMIGYECGCGGGGRT